MLLNAAAYIGLGHRPDAPQPEWGVNAMGSDPHVLVGGPFDGYVLHNTRPSKVTTEWEEKPELFGHAPQTWRLLSSGHLWVTAVSAIRQWSAVYGPWNGKWLIVDEQRARTLLGLAG